MKDSCSHHHGSSSFENRSFRSDDDDTNASSFSLLNTPQQDYLHRQVTRESALMVDGSDGRSSTWKNQQDRQEGDHHHDVDFSLPRKEHPRESDSEFFDEFEKTNMYQASQGTQPPKPPARFSNPGIVPDLGLLMQPLDQHFTDVTCRSDDDEACDSIHSEVPVLQASVVDDHDDTSSPTARSDSVAVRVEAMGDVKSTKRSCCVALQDRRLLAILLILVVAILCFAVGMGIMVLASSDATKNTTAAEYTTATPIPSPVTMVPSTRTVAPITSTMLPITNMAPSTSPTKVLPTLSPHPQFSPPSPTQCQQVKTGNLVQNQDQMIQKTFYVELDVVVEPNVVSNDLDQHFAVLVDHMQSRLAPKLTQCDTLHPQGRTLLLRGDTYYARIQKRRRHENDNTMSFNRNLAGVSDYLVANARFANTVLVTNRPCRVGTPQPCYKVIETVDLYIKQEELDIHLISHIMNVFDHASDEASSLAQLLDLTFPFKSIGMIGVASNIYENNNNNVFDNSNNVVDETKTSDDEEEDEED